MHKSLFFALTAVLGLLSPSEPSAQDREAPVIFDVMTFENKPDLGLSHDLTFLYAWEATLHDEEMAIAKTGIKKEPSAQTIERDALIAAIQRRKDSKYVVIDIESLSPAEDDIAQEYLRIAKSAVNGTRIAWWNTGPSYIPSPFTFNKQKWQTNWSKRLELEETNDFAIFGSYFLKANDTVESWAARELPRIAEFRRRFPTKILFVTLAPHPFLEGDPWQYVKGDVFGKTLDLVASQPVDGIVLWSFEGVGRIQKWDENHEWVQELRKRIGANARYKAP